MKEPRFWQEGGWQVTALLPLAGLHGWLRDIYDRWRNHKPVPSEVPVVVVGGLRVGGSGKTPFVRHLRRRLLACGEMPHVLLRGYGRSGEGVHEVDPDNGDFRMFGDEALLHAADGTTWVGADRVEAGRRAVAAGASLLLLDDGLQSMPLRADIAFLVVDAAAPTANGHLMPAGPLREKPERAASRADALVLVNQGYTPSFWHRDKPLFRFRRRLRSPVALNGRSVTVVTGIADPSRFLRDLTALGAGIVDHYAFADHHTFTHEEIFTIWRHSGDRPILTTRKDWIRLDEGWRARVHPVDLDLTEEPRSQFGSWFDVKRRGDRRN
ncbi:MAG: tetraacyldisaccharide 4'-kinase [Geminicoccaceae bacterium]|nr:tetraacyldisaccharide 4'-kinase [Geminicoccaceae bacterium]